ncbi:sugar phosphate isomerase/epimerase [Dyadobacter sp. CY312]|uniref:sugar phosphate isomerase/epimerase family protein n=1 Tax=Dyadobacter sp. CY312 TaxID=2907303 RepID=UPI001F2326F6|nr:sugar phosphate isomerase/epimerase family protein [Dyadobacter sp. CY312]MCE7039554.1 sugar phosphate isomerase/epimerase [Dyadobacter sp. CY312]
MKLTKLTLGYCLVLLFSLSALAQKNPEDKAGWKLGAQSYTFRLFTFAEALKKIDSCGLKYVEAFPGQTIGGGIEGKMDFKMDPAKRKEVKALLKKHGIVMTAYGVVKGKDKAEWEQLFEFAKDMGVLNIDTEPDPDQFAYIIPMAEKYKINIALHNHPKPSRYWHPDTVLKYAAGSKFIGSCSDIGHWVRSGLDPVACLKQLEGHVMGMHFKDVVKDTPDGKYHDVVWGKGDSKVDQVIAEMKRQKFKGPISVEYEYHWENNGPEVAESVKYFRETYVKQK